MALWGLAAALAAPAVGVLLYAWLHERQRLARIVDGFVYVAVPLLIGWQVVPRSWSWPAMLPLAAVVLGLAAVTAVDRALGRFAARAYAARADDTAILTGLSGVALHAMAEGAAFVPSATGVPPTIAFATAVALHRVLVGLLIWWLVRPRHGPLLAWLGVATVPVATLAGYLFASQFGSIGEGSGAVLYRAFVAGTLLHVVFHQGRRDHDHGRSSRREPRREPPTSR